MKQGNSGGRRSASPREARGSHLRFSYTLFAPIYDLVLRRVSDPLRRESFAALELHDRDVLIAGIGSGLDIPHLPSGARYVGIDLTPAMLQRARRRAQARNDLVLHQGDVMDLPYPDACFDVVVMHLILAVVPDPCRALGEAMRVVRPGGEVLVLDKFLKPGERAPLRRAVNALSRRLATRLDVVFEDLLPCATGLQVTQDQPALARGWFRRIRLRRLHA